MTIMADVFRVSIIGVGPGSEVFDTSCWVRSGAPTSGSAANTLAGQIRDAWQTAAAASWKGMLASTQRYSEVRLYSYPTGGPVASYIGTAAIAAGDGIASQRTPLQTCMVASLKTGFAGRRARGRMYLPATGQVPASDHSWTLAQVTGVANATAAFFTAINAINTIGEVCVLSQVGAGSSTPVNAVSVDGKPDVQRRRANKYAGTTTFTSAVTI